MSYELIITEKPQAAKKIAAALADGKPIVQKVNGIFYYEITHGNRDIVVGCAVGHLYTVAEKNKGKWTYPVFDAEWKPTSVARKSAAYSAKYLTVLRKLAKGADEFTVATDYDIEGEVIGLNVVKYACKQKDANRMKFSTLTAPDLVKAYENKSKTLDWGQANAGETRHFLDWYFGINISRALSLSIKAATGMHKVLSSGRVQGPALKIIVDKEKEIKAFKSDPYWQIELNGAVTNGALIAWHKEDKFWKKPEAEEIVKKVKGKHGKISDINRHETKQQPPVPFDLTSLQIEAYRTLRISPKDTLSVAQSLYTDGYISYPRTSSQQLPKEIGYTKILKQLMKQDMFSKECSQLLKKTKLEPNNGKKVDAAHPAIYPTGIMPRIEGREQGLYELIVRRFMATFSEYAIRETLKLSIDVNSEIFIAKGTRTVEPGWHKYYGRFVMQKEEELPNVSKGEDVEVKKITLHDKETQPPKRYTPASIIKELEKRGLGTKATRASIVEALYDRGYVFEKSITATNLGMATIDILEKYCPQILDEELTKNFEEEMNSIREYKKKEGEVLDEAKTFLGGILADFKKNEQELGKELADATIQARDEMSEIGKCPKCDTGTLQIRGGKFGQFIACNKYPDCKTTFSLPRSAKVKSAKKECEECGYPMIVVLKGKRTQTVCINPHCPTKGTELDGADEAAQVDLKCEKCGKPMVLRHSLYGSFYGCSGYPKCRSIVKIEKKEDKKEKKDDSKEETKKE